MENVSFEARHVRVSDAIFRAEMGEIAEHPADGVAQLAVSVDRGLENLRPDAQVVRIVGGAYPHAQDIGARGFDDILRRHRVAKRLRHFAAVLIEHEAVGEHDVERRHTAGATALDQRGMEPAAVLVGAFQVHDGIRPAIPAAADAGKARKMFRVFQREGVSRARIEPDIEDVIDLVPVLVREFAEKAFARSPRIPDVGALALEGFRDAGVDTLVVEDFDVAVALFAHEHRDRHAPGALARDDPIGLALDHAGDAVLALRRHPAGVRNFAQSNLPQSVSCLTFGTFQISSDPQSKKSNSCANP